MSSQAQSHRNGEDVGKSATPRVGEVWVANDDPELLIDDNWFKVIVMAVPYKGDLTIMSMATLKGYVGLTYFLEHWHRAEEVIS